MIIVMIPFIGNVMQIPRDRKYIRDCQVKREMRRYCLMSIEFLFGMVKKIQR
jgi:hypothetical protein